METLQTDLSHYMVTLPHDDFLPKHAPKEKLDLMLHHAQVEAQENGYRKIEQETGLTREHLAHRWFNTPETSICVFTLDDEAIHGVPGISMVRA